MTNENNSRRRKRHRRVSQGALYTERLMHIESAA